MADRKPALMSYRNSFLQQFLTLPPSRPGMKIGLLGGSFNPAHAGHVHITQQAMKRLSLDAVWWMVSPHNPLKTRRDMARFDKRLVSAWNATRALTHVHVTAFEKNLTTTRTADNLRFLVNTCPDVHFVWLMGEDNWKTIHTWGKWPLIFETLPVAVLPRKTKIKIKKPPAEQIFKSVVQRFASKSNFAFLNPPAIGLIRCPRMDISSTEIRQKKRHFSF